MLTHGTAGEAAGRSRWQKLESVVVALLNCNTSTCITWILNELSGIEFGGIFHTINAILTELR